LCRAAGDALIKRNGESIIWFTGKQNDCKIDLGQSQCTKS
jgi:hypothetical protein